MESKKVDFSLELDTNDLAFDKKLLEIIMNFFIFKNTFYNFKYENKLDMTYQFSDFGNLVRISIEKKN
ncbi:hypothetical protein BpHYR1_012158 [Brachionus plicatilis]|uniref:Uncharacterized protein n=1 Tax=Brachionus plicatilis TaxID=10195 RepID=A0A3M7SCR0_BRAPC|nr:hypothetical protein BpHYR1_012158 [Brachionus plicatilis]